MAEVTRDEWEVFTRRVSAAGKHSSWLDGLGLERPEDRWDRMSNEAIECFEAQILAGKGVHEACDIALGLTNERRGDLTHITKEGITTAAKDLLDTER